MPNFVAPIRPPLYLSLTAWPIRPAYERGRMKMNHSHGYAVLLGTALVLSAFSACSKTEQQLTPQAEAEASWATVNWLDNKFGVVDDPEVVSYFEKFGVKLGHAVPAVTHESEIEGLDITKYQSLKWQVFVLKSDQPNAFSSGGGVIFLTRGLVKAMNNECELAAVVTHEMAHEILGHVGEAIYRSLTAKKGETPGFAFSLDYELDADTVGLRILTGAGYPPQCALDAITNGYHGARAQLTSVNQEWREPRLANLRQQLGDFGLVAPTAGDSREFNHIKSRL